MLDIFSPKKEFYIITNPKFILRDIYCQKYKICNMWEEKQVTFPAPLKYWPHFQKKKKISNTLFLYIFNGCPILRRHIILSVTPLNFFNVFYCCCTMLVGLHGIYPHIICIALYLFVCIMCVCIRIYEQKDEKCMDVCVGWPFLTLTREGGNSPDWSLVWGPRGPWWMTSGLGSMCNSNNFVEA